MTDLASGASKSVLSRYLLQACGVSASQHYSLSLDGTEIAFSMLDKTGQSKLWIAPTDQRSSPREIESNVSEDCPFFLPNGDLTFRAAEGDTHFLYRMKSDGTERRKISDREIFDPYGASHDGRWVLAQTRGPDPEHPYSVAAFPINGGPPLPVCLFLCESTWDRTGKTIYILGKNTYALPLLRNGLPRIPPAGISNREELDKIKAPVVDPGVAESGGTPLQYAYTSSTIRRNLYRIPLP